MLQSFADEPTANVRNKIGDATAEIARQMFDTGQLELLKYPKWGECKDADIKSLVLYRGILA